MSMTDLDIEIERQHDLEVEAELDRIITMMIEDTSSWLGDDGWTTYENALKEAKQYKPVIRKLFLGVFLELVGEDNYIIKRSGNSRLDQSVQSEISGENKLRHKLVAAAKQRLGSK